ncbi:MAG: ribosome silencing factor, partial [Monoglobales bacterium]
MTSKEIALKAAEILNSKKAIDIKVLEIKDLTTICDYFVICTGTSTPHIKALCDETGEKLAESYDLKSREEGYNAANWLLMDYGSVVIHIFNEESREFYGLERLWS